MGQVLAQAQAQGLVGPGPVGSHLDHSLSFARLIAKAPDAAVDLGSGGGIPGLVLATWWPTSRWLLLDAGARRAAFLRSAVPTLGLADRVEVRQARAELVGREASHRGKHDLVVARSFGPPAVTAECAAPLLRIGGSLVVAEPPEGGASRWPAQHLGVLGLVLDGRTDDSPSLQRLRQASPCPDRFPRRDGAPAKRPLF